MSIFIYAIVAAQHDPCDQLLLETTSGVSEDGSLYLIEQNAISVVVSNVKKDSLKPDHSTVMAYAGVIEKLAKQYDVLPVRFGTLVETTESVKYLLRKNHAAIEQNLLLVKNKCEFGLKVFCDSKRLKDKFQSKLTTGQKEDHACSLHTKESMYLDYVSKKLAVHRYEEFCLNYTNSIILDITECLARLSPMSRFEKQVTETNLISAVFLVEKDKENELIHAVKTVKKKHFNLNFVLTGPWPPYNFVKVTNQ